MIARFTALLVACFAMPVFAADPAPAVTREFKLTVAVDVVTNEPGTPVRLTGDTVYRYAWKQEGNERTLLLRSSDVNAKVGEHATIMKMSRTGISAVLSGKSIEKKYEDASEDVKRMFRDTFDSPLYKLELDSSGKEVKRTVVAGPGAKTMIDTFLIANTTLFHPWFAKNLDEWQADGAVGAGQGEFTGKLTYTKLTNGKSGQVVKVAGTLKADGTKTGQGAAVKDGKYVVTGTQTYDADRKEWVSGKLDIEISFGLVQGGKEIGTGKGTHKMTFEMLPEKK